MIKGINVTMFSPDPVALRTFLGDKLGLSSFHAGDDWVIFNVPEAEIGCHDPIEMEGVQRPAGRGEIFQELSFYCDDIDETVHQLKERGVKFTSDIDDRGYALSARFEVPGGGEFEVYQPKYQK